MSKYINLFFRRISKDFKQKELLPLKLLFFMHSSTILVLYPYLTIHMRELGINVEETAIMSAVTPIAAILMPPLAGMVADKIGNFRVLLAFFSGVGGASALLLLLVPVGRITVTYPEKVVLGVSCTPEDPIGLTMHNQQACKYLEPHLTKTDLQIEACGFVCQAFIDESDTSVIFTTKNYGVQMHDIENNKTKMYRYTLSDIDIYTPTVISETKNHKTLKNNERYTTAVRKLSKNSFFFPTNTLFNFSCETTDNISNCIFGEKQQLEKMKKFPHRFMADVDQNNVNTMEEQTSYTLTNIASGKLPTKCSHTYGQAKEHISVTIPFYHKNDTTPYKHLDLGSCAPRCIATAPRKQFCSNQNTVLEINMKLTFWSYLSVRVFIAIVSGTSFAMFEGAAIAILREHKADYGLQRIYATIGGMISSPLSGWLIDFASRGKGYNDFSPIFFLYAALKLVSAFLMLFINLEFKTPATSVVSDVISVLKKIEMVALFISCFVLGIAWGYIESFLFWLLQDLGGSKSLMGLTITVGGIVGIPLLVMSGPIIKRLGHANVIFIGFVFYAIRLLGYSLIYNPWLCLIFEAMESITFSLSFTAAVTYAAKLSTVTTDTSIQGMLGGLYYGVGKGAGSLIGGYLIKAITIRTTFQVFSCFTAVTGSVYFLFYHFYMKKRPSDGTDITKKDTEKIPQGLPDIDLSAKSIENIKVDVNKQAVTNMAYEENETNTDINNKNIANNNQNLE